MEINETLREGVKRTQGRREEKESERESNFHCNFGTRRPRHVSFYILKTQRYLLIKH